MAKFHYYHCRGAREAQKHYCTSSSGKRQAMTHSSFHLMYFFILLLLSLFHHLSYPLALSSSVIPDKGLDFAPQNWEPIEKNQTYYWIWGSGKGSEEIWVSLWDILRTCHAFQWPHLQNRILLYWSAFCYCNEIAETTDPSLCWCRINCSVLPEWGIQVQQQHLWCVICKILHLTLLDCRYSVAGLTWFPYFFLSSQLLLSPIHYFVILLFPPVISNHMRE